MHTHIHTHTQQTSKADVYSHMYPRTRSTGRWRAPRRHLCCAHWAAQWTLRRGLCTARRCSPSAQPQACWVVWAVQVSVAALLRQQVWGVFCLSSGPLGVACSAHHRPAAYSAHHLPLSAALLVRLLLLRLPRHPPTACLLSRWRDRLPQLLVAVVVLVARFSPGAQSQAALLQQLVAVVGAHYSPEPLPQPALQQPAAANHRCLCT